MSNLYIVPQETLDFSSPDYLFYNVHNDKQNTYLIKHINCKNVVIETDAIQLTAYGIPRINEDYCPSDAYREYIMLPFDLSQSSCVTLKDTMKRADEYFASLPFKIKLFGSKAGKHMYHPIIRSKSFREEDDSDDDNYIPKKNLPMDYCKVKFIMNYDSNGKKINETKTVLKTNGEAIEVKTITDLSNYIKFRSVAKYTIMFQKIWACKTPVPGSNFFMYGAGLTILEINTGRHTPISVDLSNPIYELDKLKEMYKEYMDGKKKLVKKCHNVIEI